MREPANRLLPKGFEAMLEQCFGSETAGRLIDTLRVTEPETAVRVNVHKSASVPAMAERVPWEPRGFYLPERPLFAGDPAWHQGRYYVQDASSMALGTVVENIVRNFFTHEQTINYLDACAAPGGKTIAALDALGERAFVVANEADRHRAAVLAENIAKHGAPNVAVAAGPAQRFGALGAVFDIIAVDAPCSGEGMMRKEPEAIAQWSPALIEDCAALQKDIVASLWPALREGGVMIYSTCTFNGVENEGVAAFAAREFRAEPIALDTSSFPGAITTGMGLHFLPGLVRGEGLYLCAFRKTSSSARAPKTKPLPKPEGGIKELASCALADCDQYILTGNFVIPAMHRQFAEALQAAAGIYRLGLPLGTLKGRDIVPSHELAMSTALKPGAFPALELDYGASTAYLRGESMHELPPSLAKGLFLPAWKGLPLGFAKNIGRRANNLYPDNFRLRLQAHQLPAQAPVIVGI